MTDRKPATLSGDAKWKAVRAEVAKRNDAACRRGRELRAAHDAEAASRRREAERREVASLPVQPQP
jgi:hypothetical protein